MELLILIVQILVIVTAVSTAFAYVTLFERRLLARFQHRVGPNRAGPWGLLQPIADAIKLFFKEDIIPDKADKWVYLAAPAIAVITALIMWAVIPLGCWNIAGDYRACFAGSGEPLHNMLQIADVNIGVLYLMAITSIGSMVSRWQGGQATANTLCSAASARRHSWCRMNWRLVPPPWAQ